MSEHPVADNAAERRPWPIQGEMAALIGALDWTATPLGPIEGWPPGLKAAVQLVLAQGFPTNVCVGSARTLIYNDAYARLIGAKHPDALGRDVRMAFAEVAPLFAPVLDRVFAGETVTLSDQLYPFRRTGELEDAWFDISYSPLRDHAGTMIAAFVVHNETTSRVRVERELRASEARQAFLLRLSDRVRDLKDPVAVMAAACEELGRQLGAGQVAYADIDEVGELAIIERDWNDGTIPSNAARHRLSEFGPPFIAELKRGRTIVIDDVGRDPRTSSPAALATFGRVSIAAFLNVPLVKAGRLVAILAVHSRTARVWLPAEVALTEEVAERSWAAVERARAEAGLRESEERFRQFAENSADVLWIVNAPEPRLEYLSPAFETIWGEARAAVVGDLGRWATLVHPDDRERAAGAMPRVLAGETYGQEYRIVRPDGEVRWIQDTGFPIRDSSGRVHRVAGIAQDVTARKLADEEVGASRRRLRSLIEGIPQLVWRSVDGGEWTWASPQWSTYTGQSEAECLGRGWLAAVHPDDRTVTMEAWERADAGALLEVDHRLYHAAEDRYRWFQTRARLVRDERTGAVLEWLGTSTDVDELVQFQDRQHLLLQELDHRVKNMLAVVLAIARQTGERAANLPAFLEAFEGRINALTTAHSLLTLSGWRGAPLPDLARAALAPHDTGEGRIAITAEEVWLTPAAAQSLVLALHELATNAIKYGGLSTAEGRVELAGRVEDAELVLTWREAGGPPVPGPPAEAGFGTTLLEQVITYQHGGRIVLDWRPEGLAGELSLPLAEVAGRKEGRAAPSVG